MNQTLEKAISFAKNFPEKEQEELGNEFLRLLEEKEIDAKLAKSEANGGDIPAAEAFEFVRKNIKQKYGIPG